MNKLLLPVLALLGVMSTSGHAFSLDAAGYEGGGVAVDPMSIMVPGYGEVVFETGFGMPLVVDPAYCSGKGEVPETWSIDEPGIVRIEFVALAGEDGPEVVADAGGGRPVSVWSVIPEPASAGLGLIGVLMLLLGRWR